MERIIKVESCCHDGWLITRIVTTKHTLTFKIATEIKCCEDVDIRYYQNTLTDLIDAQFLNLETNIKKEEIPKEIPDEIVTRLKQDLNMTIHEEYGYLVNRINYHRGKEDKILYLIMINSNVNYGHRVVITNDDENLLDLWL